MTQAVTMPMYHCPWDVMYYLHGLLTPGLGQCDTSSQAEWDVMYH
jgi:hypothetical protein